MIHDMDYQKFGYFDCGSDIRLVGRITRDYSKMKFLENKQQMQSRHTLLVNIHITVLKGECL